MKTRKHTKASGYAPEEQQPRARLVRKDGTELDHGPVALGVNTIERLGVTKYRYTGERDGIYRIFSEE